MYTIYLGCDINRTQFSYCSETLTLSHIIHSLWVSARVRSRDQKRHAIVINTKTTTIINNTKREVKTKKNEAVKSIRNDKPKHSSGVEEICIKCFHFFFHAFDLSFGRVHTFFFFLFSFVCLNKWNLWKWRRRNEDNKQATSGDDGNKQLIIIIFFSVTVAIVDQVCNDVITLSKANTQRLVCHFIFHVFNRNTNREKQKLRSKQHNLVE